MSSAQIIEHFNSLRFVRESSRYRITFDGRSERHKIKLESATAYAVSDIQHLMEANSQFFSDHDYEWCLQSENYDNAIEATLQRDLLSTISKSTPSSSQYACLGGIAVRVMGTASITGHAFNSGGHRYIVLSTSLVRSVSRVAYILASLRTHHGCETPKSVMQKLGNEIGEIRHLVEMLAAALISCARYVSQTDQSFLSLDAFDLDDDVFVSYAGRAILSGYARWARRFVLLHELAHLIQHDLSSSERDESEEIEADLKSMEFLSEVFPEEPEFARGGSLFLGLAHLCLVATLFVEFETAVKENRKPEPIIEQAKRALVQRTKALMEFLESRDSNAFREFDETLGIMEVLRIAMGAVMQQAFSKSD
jgi:hypothetical protein